ncbi:hypothetical protein TTHERM_00141020 (macronuclear) [Tetrahymena thermophila SB210]|uniref:Uncharacterized protein n=1 Tax=Tetrahymena thermophila (strain SB210) TaxID=312017 RepID=I7MDR2_TETTS|nr:hypothetical protein TTHERM_00141020 [Tetrahymena thermophila SB210]EAR90794.2 hypothetical protein TTHERM_00141020 [Tetrahymena thermophila SB210]|eukprot:XP_001011039.2 hypothetical protein TTHERM_00141020 [Tetrahymena thermophila SB210]
MDDLNKQYVKRLSKYFIKEKNRQLQNSLMLFMIMQNSPECQEQVLTPQSSAYEIDQYFNSKSQMTELIKKIDLTLQDQYFQKNYPQSFSSQSSISSDFKSESNPISKVKKLGQKEEKQILQVENLIQKNEKPDSNNEQKKIDLEQSNDKRKFIEICDQENIEEIIYKKVKSDWMNPQNNSEMLQQLSNNDGDICKSNQESISSLQQENLDCKQLQNESQPIQKQGEGSIILSLAKVKEKEQEENQKESTVDALQAINNEQNFSLKSSQEKINQKFVDTHQGQNIQEQVKPQEDKADVTDSQKDYVENKKDELDSKNVEIDSKKDEMETERDDVKIKQDNIESKNDQTNASNLSKEICTVQDQNNDDNISLRQQAQEINQIIILNSDQKDLENNVEQSQIVNEKFDTCQLVENKQVNEEQEQAAIQSQVIEQEEKEENIQKNEIEIQCDKGQTEDKINIQSINQVENQMNSSIEKNNEGFDKNLAQQEQDNLKDLLIEDSQTNIEFVKQLKNDREEESQTIVLKNDFQRDDQNSTDQIKQDKDLIPNQIDSLKNNCDSKQLENSEMQVENQENQSNSVKNRAIQGEEEQMEIEQENCNNKDMNQNEKKQVCIEISDGANEDECANTNQILNDQNGQHLPEKQEVEIQENKQNVQQLKEFEVQEKSQKPKDIIQLEDDDNDENTKNSTIQLAQGNKQENKTSQIINEAEEIDSTEIDPQEIINLYSLEFFTRKQKYLQDILEKKQEDQKNQQDTQSYQNTYLKQNNHATYKQGDQKSQALRKQKEDIKWGIETKSANIKNDDIQKYIQPSQNSNIAQTSQQPSESAKSSIQKSKLVQSEINSAQKDQAFPTNRQNSKSLSLQQNSQQDKLSKPNTQQKQEQKIKESKTKNNSNQKKAQPIENKQSVEQQKQEQAKQQQQQLEQQIQNQKMMEQRVKQFSQNVSLINIQDSRKNVPKNAPQQQKQVDIIDLESSDDEQKQKGGKDPYITIDSDGKLPQQKHQEIEIRKMDKTNNNNNQNSSSIEITQNPQNKFKQGSDIQQEKNIIMKQQTIDLEDDSDVQETSNRQQFLIQQQNQSKRQQQHIDLQYQHPQLLIQQQINNQQQQKYKKQQTPQQIQQVSISDDEDSNNRQFNQQKQPRVPYNMHHQSHLFPEGSIISYQFQPLPQSGLQGTISQGIPPHLPQYIHQYPQPPLPHQPYYAPYFPYQSVQPHLANQLQGIPQQEELSFHGKDSNEEYYMLNQQQQYRSKDIGKRDNGQQKDRNNSSANKNISTNNNACDISSSESLQPPNVNSKIQSSNQQMLQQNQKKQQPIQQAPIQYKQFINQGPIQLQPPNSSQFHQQNQFSMGYDMANYMNQQGYALQMAQRGYPYVPQTIQTANGPCLIYGNQFPENQLSTEKDTKLGGLEYSSLSGGLDQQNAAQENKISKAQEILLYAMQVGQTENFDKIMQVNEQKEKHKKPDTSKPTDVECTKNLLRNLNQTMLRFLQRSKISKNMMAQYFQDYENGDEEIEKFKKWALGQKMDNFQQCRNLWIYNESTPNYEYLKLFREIQFEFFSNSSCPAIFYSKVRNQESKRTHLKYISSFLEGIVYPNSFTCFKKSSKLKEQEKEIQLRKQNNFSDQMSSPMEKSNLQHENRAIKYNQTNEIEKEEYIESLPEVEEDEKLLSGEGEKEIEKTIEIQSLKQYTIKDKSFQENIGQYDKTIEIKQP